ncbi:MAG: riboflavin synthase [Fibromonadaceae bacterium]|jgi:riboflavin synthase|nr:riboflavin synthase [Fibromonadaceae bacterium]
MFTGIVQTCGKITELNKLGDAVQMKIFAENYFESCKKGDSVANNGVCLTIEGCTQSEAVFTMIKQTIDNTSFKNACIGSMVNLELPCRPNSFMGGHFVMGHIDSTATVKEIVNRETGMEIDLEIPESLSKYVINRGSIALDGISLTVAEKLSNTLIRVAIIPETIRVTNIGHWQPGTLVNVEVDMLGKYIENLLGNLQLSTLNSQLSTP